VECSAGGINAEPPPNFDFGFWIDIVGGYVAQTQRNRLVFGPIAVIAPGRIIGDQCEKQHQSANMATRPPIMPPHNETEHSVSRITREGKQLTYKLSVMQQPERARACGAGAKCKDQDMESGSRSLTISSSIGRPSPC
jgi:hypothetical protein